MSRRAQGYALLEVLIAASVTCAIVGVLLQLAIRGQEVLRAQGDLADLQQRLRVAVASLQRDIRNAGAGPSAGRLIERLPPVRPARTGERRADAELACFDDRLSLFWVPDGGAESTVVAAMAGPGAPIVFDRAAPGCGAGGTCGFGVGDRVLIVDPGPAGSGYDIFTVAAAGVGQLSSAAPLSRAYPAGSIVVGITQRVYYLDRATRRLMVYDGDASDVPLVDHVVDLRFSYWSEPVPGGAPRRFSSVDLTSGPALGLAPNRFDADLLQVRRVGVEIRLSAEAADLRGRGAGFLEAGFSAGGSVWVPDQQMTFDVSPPNMRPSR
jgi:hypothetical protein